VFGVLAARGPEGWTLFEIQIPGPAVACDAAQTKQEQYNIMGTYIIIIIRVLPSVIVKQLVRNDIVLLCYIIYLFII